MLRKTRQAIYKLNEVCVVGGLDPRAPPKSYGVEKKRRRKCQFLSRTEEKNNSYP